jgi:transposase
MKQEQKQIWSGSMAGRPVVNAFLDETGANTNMVRLDGRAPRGQRLFAPVPYGHWMAATFVAALRHDEITAPCVFDGPMNGASFLTYVEHFLAPVLQARRYRRHGQSCQPLGKQSSTPARQCAILNPIEQVFAKLKAALRKAAARTFDTLVEAAMNIFLRRVRGVLAGF